MERIRKDYFEFSQKLETLKNLARINWDLLFSVIDGEKYPHVGQELGKVKELVKALRNEEETLKDKTRKHQNKLSSTGDAPIDQCLDEMAAMFTEQEIMDAFLRFLQRAFYRKLTNDSFSPKLPLTNSCNDDFDLSLSPFEIFGLTTQPSSSKTSKRKLTTRSENYFLEIQSHWQKATAALEEIGKALRDERSPFCVSKTAENNAKHSKQADESQRVTVTKYAINHKPLYSNDSCDKIDVDDDNDNASLHRVTEYVDNVGEVKKEIITECLDYSSGNGDSENENNGDCDWIQQRACSSHTIHSNETLSSAEQGNFGDNDYDAKDNEIKIFDVQGVLYNEDNNKIIMNQMSAADDKISKLKRTDNCDVEHALIQKNDCLSFDDMDYHLMNCKGDQTNPKDDGSEVVEIDGDFSMDRWSLISQDATTGSTPHLSDLDSCTEENLDQITTVNKKRKSTKSQMPKVKLKVDDDDKPKTYNNITKDLLKEFGLPLTIANQDSNSRGPMVCPICSKEYKLFQPFIFHLRWHKKERDGVIDDERVLCTICGKTLKNKGCLRSHLRCHDEEDKGEYFKCSMCEKEFLGKRKLWHHVRSIHTLKRSFMCDYCGKAFKTKYVLRQHLGSVHLNAKKKCNICGKEISSVSNLSRHMRIHRADLPYPCSFCGKRFRYSEGRKHHEFIHTKDFPYKCSMCDHPGFTTPFLLRGHEKKCLSKGSVPNLKRRRRQRRLSGEKKHKHCEICGKEFNDHGNLKRHIKLHEGLKPYQCSTCGRSFSTVDVLKSHLWTHTDKKKYPCDKCDRGFNDKRNLLSHFRRVHPGHINSVTIKPRKTPAGAKMSKVQDDCSENNSEKGEHCHQQISDSVSMDVVTDTSCPVTLQLLNNIIIPVNDENVSFDTLGGVPDLP